MNFIEVQEHQKKKTLSSLDKKQKICDTLAALFALIGYILEYSQYERYYVQIVYTYLSSSSGDFELRLRNENEATPLTVLRVFVLITTLLCLFMVYLRYELDIQITIIKKNLSMPIQLQGQELIQRKNPIKKLVSRKYRWMALEFFVLFIHSLPKVNVNFSSSFQGTFLQYSLDMIFFIWTNTRIYLLVRIIRHYNKWMTEDAEAVCKTQGNFSITAFGLKALKKENPFLTIALLLVILMLIAGLSMRTLERPYELISGLNWDTFANALWCTFAIITTVGYGDFYPKTLAGRIMALIACFAGQFFVSLIITTITQNVEFTNPQNRAYHRMVTEFTATKLEKTTANVIKFGLRHFVDVKIRKTHKTYNNNYKKFMLNLLEFKALRKSIAIEEANLSFGFYIEKFREDVNNKKYDVIKAVRKLDNLSLRMKTLETYFKENYEMIDKAVSSLHQYNSNMLSAFEQVEAKTSKRQTFDKIHQNLYALERIDELEQINQPFELITKPAETPKLQKVASSPSPYLSPRKSASSTLLLDEKKKERLMKRIQKAQENVDSELMNMLDDQSLPAMSLKHKRALSKNENAKDLLGTILVIKKRFVDKRKKTAYISGNTLAKTILELNEDGAAKSPVALLSTLHPSGPIKTEEDDDDDQNSRPSLTEPESTIKLRSRAMSQIEPNDAGIKGKLRERWQRAKSIALIPKKFFNVLPIQEEKNNHLKAEPQLIYEKTTEIKYHTKGTLVIHLSGGMNGQKKSTFKSQLAKPHAPPTNNLNLKFTMENISHQKQAIHDTSFEDEPSVEKPARRSILTNSPDKQLSPQKRGSNLSVRSDKKSRQLTWKNVQEEHLHSHEDESSPRRHKISEDQIPNSPTKQRARLASIDPSYIPTPTHQAQPQEIDSSLSLTDNKKELEKVTPTLTEAGLTARQPAKSHYVGDLFQHDSRKTSLLETKPSTNRTSQPLSNHTPPPVRREYVFKKHQTVDYDDDEDDVTKDPSVLDFKAALDNIEDKNSVTHTYSHIQSTPGIYPRRESDLRKNLYSNPLTRMGSVLSTLNGLDRNLDSDRDTRLNSISRMRTFDHHHNENRRTESLFKLNRNASQENDAIDNMLKNLNFTDSNFRVPTDNNPNNNVSNHNFFEPIDRDLEPVEPYAPKHNLDAWDVDLVNKIKSENTNQRNKRNLLDYLKK